MLMSQTLVAFTIEFDNEFEHRMPHRTTKYGTTPGASNAPWLVSMAMWVHCMRHVPAGGIRAADLARQSLLAPKSAEIIIRRMSGWWGYLRVAPDPADSRDTQPPSAWLVRPTPAGSRAQQVWEPLTDVIDARWRSRYGEREIDELRGALVAVVDQLDVALPDFLPIGQLLGSPRAARSFPVPSARSELPLPALLSKTLLAFSLDFGREVDLPLELSANVVRVLDDEGVRVRHLSALAGVAEMGVENSLSVLQRRGYVSVVSDPSGGRAKLARLTASGLRARSAYRDRVAAVTSEWEARFGTDVVRTLRDSLEALVGGGTAGDSPLAAALEPYPDGWRSQLPRPGALPHYPLVSHRGGFPDGS